MEGNQTDIGLNVSGDVHARDISVVQTVNNIIKPADPPAKNIRFKVEKPIQTFTGRETFLEELHKVVKEGQDGGEGGVTVLTQEPLSVVAATGGIGKTETVRRYIQLHEHEYDHIIWIDAEENSFAQRQFLQLAMELKISTEFEGKQKEFDSILKEIFGTLLQEAHVVLLVFDNAEALEDNKELSLSGIRSLCPKSLSPFFVEPTIIITSRNQNWSLQKVIHLDLWTEAEVVLFVTGRLVLEKNSENEALAAQLGTHFGRLPIALQSAVAVILQQTKRKKNYGIQNLKDEYESGIRKVLAQKPLEANMRPTLTSIPMLVLWNISLEKIVRYEDGKLAIKILCFMAYMSPNRIPQDFLFVLFKNSCSEDSFENALEILEDYSLITSLSSEDPDFRSFSIHRMIQDSTIENLRTRTNEGETPHEIFNEATFLNETQVLLKLSAESVDYLVAFEADTLSRNGELVETAVQITNHVSTQLNVKEFRELTKWAAELLRVTNNFPKSIELFERALKATPSHDETELDLKMNLQVLLAIACHQGGDFQKSLELLSNALEVKTDFRGPHHKEILFTKNLVAMALRDLGRYDEATEMFREVLQGYENNDDTQSEGFIITKTDFAALWLLKGEAKEAFELFIPLSKKEEEDQDSNFHMNITTRTFKALKLWHKGHLEEALKINLQNIEEATKRLGPFHPLTLQCRRHYAAGLHEQGKHDLAAPLLLELLETEETQLGALHPSTLTTKLLLADAYLGTKELDKAEVLLDVQMWENAIGPEHPETMGAAMILSGVKKEQGKLGEALELQKKVLEVRKNVLAPNHKDTLSTMQNICALHFKMGEYEKAAEVAKELLERQEEVLGKDHPDAVPTLEFLTSCMELPVAENNLTETFMAITSVDAETGKLFLQASKWKLEAALDIVANIKIVNMLLTWKNRTRN